MSEASRARDTPPEYVAEGLIEALRPDSLIAKTWGTSEEIEEGTGAETGSEIFAGIDLMSSWLVVVELCCVCPFCLGRFKRNAMTFPNPWNNEMGILIRWQGQRIVSDCLSFKLGDVGERRKEGRKALRYFKLTKLILGSHEAVTIQRGC
jgi:hypothetical protein